MGTAIAVTRISEREGVGGGDFIERPSSLQ